MIAVDTMYDLRQGMSIPYPYNYAGYDLLLGGPPAGRKDTADWEEMIGVYIGRGMGYVQHYNLKGFGLYEWGGYTGGVWYEDEQLAVFEQILTREQAKLIAEAMVR